MVTLTSVRIDVDGLSLELATLAIPWRPPVAIRLLNIAHEQVLIRRARSDGRRGGGIVVCCRSERLNRQILNCFLALGKMPGEWGRLTLMEGLFPYSDCVRVAVLGTRRVIGVGRSDSRG